MIDLFEKLKANMNVRGKLLALVAFVACTSIAALTYFSYQSIRHTTIEKEGKNMLGKSEEILRFAQKVVDNSTDQLQTLALSPTIVEAVKRANRRNQNRSPSEVQALDEAWANNEARAEALVEQIRSGEASRHLKEFQKRFPEQVEVFVTGTQGLNAAMTNRTGDYLQKDEKWWQATYDGGEGAVYVGQVARDASTGSYAMNIGVPVRDEEDNTIGVLRGTVDVSSLFEGLSEVQIGETGHAALINSDGKILYARDEDMLMEPAPDAIQQLMAEGVNTAREDMTDLEGNPALVGAAFTESVDGNDLGWMLLVDQDLQELEAGLQEGLIYSLKVGAGVLVVLLLIGAWVASTIARPIRRLDRAAQEVAAGDLEATVEIDTRDEIGNLAASFNQMVEQVREALDEAQTKEHEAQAAQQEASRLAEVSQEVNDFLRSEIEDLTSRIERLEDGDLSVSFVGGGTGTTSEETDDAAQMTGQLRAKLERAVESIRETLKVVTSAAHKADDSAAEISASSDQMAASAEEQSTQAEEVAAAVEELNQTINENARSVQQTAEAAETGGREARRGGEIVTETTEKMEEIATVVERSADTIERLGDSSEEIGRVVDTIDEIAEQTNLLALNAAIEAARAGEEGKGFAVVAEEVRELAEEADAATDEIAEMIDQVQSETDEAVEVVREGTDRVEEGLELADRAGDALEEVVDSIEKVEERTDEIAAASEEQSTTSEQIARSVQSISTAARESAAGVTEVSDSTNNLEAITERLRGSVQQFELGDGEFGENGSEQARAGQAPSGTIPSQDEEVSEETARASSSSTGTVFRGNGHES